MLRPFFASTLMLLSLAACNGGVSPTNDADTHDVANTDAALDVQFDAVVDAIPSDVPVDIAPSDATPDSAPLVDVTDDGDAMTSTECAYGNCACIDLAVCENRVELVPGTPITMQDTAAGGFGDCSFCASCSGGKNLYYTLHLSAGTVTRVHASPIASGRDLLLRRMSDCSRDATTLDSSRGGAVTSGSATLCLRNDATDTQAVIIAVGVYSGGPSGPTATFDLSAEVLDPSDSCL